VLSFSRLSWHGRAGGFTEKCLGFPQRLVRRNRAMSFLQQVDQVAVLPRRIVDLGASFAPTFSLQADGETLPLSARGVANLPKIALLAPLGKILAAETLGTGRTFDHEVCDAAPRAHEPASAALTPTGCSANAAWVSMCESGA